MMRRIIRSEMWVATDPTYYNAASRTYGYTTTSVMIRGRADSFAAKKAKKLWQLRQAGLTNLVWDTMELRDTFEWNVGSFGMFSDFVDPKPILKVLGTENAIDSEANYYEATATWRYRNLELNGTWRGNGMTLKQPSARIPETESKAGQTIIFPMTSAKTTKKSQNPQSTKTSNDSFQPEMWRKNSSKIKERFRWIGFVRYRQTFYTHEWKLVGKEPVVVQQ